jgi:predicted nucleic acid-binding protein
VSRFTLDANVLVYAAAPKDRRSAAALEIVARAARLECVLTVQALGEFFSVVTRKRILPRLDALTLFEEWLELFGEPVPHSARGLLIAVQGTMLDQFQFWDAMLLATAGAAGCTALITEDMAPGDSLAGVTIVPAFAGDAVSPQARALLA